MTKCSNCVSEAFFVYRVTAAYTIPYCSRHIPNFLKKNPDRLVRISELSTSTKVSKKKKEEPVIPVVKETVETPIFEEPVVVVVEELVDEEPEVIEGA